MNKDLKELNKKIKETQEKLDESIFYFNRKNNPTDEQMIARYRRELVSLNEQKEEIQNKITQ
jgi:uncharacterized protein YecE (DUF72 family)